MILGHSRSKTARFFLGRIQHYPVRGLGGLFGRFFGSDPSTLELFGKPKLAGGAAGISFISIPVRAAGDAPPGSLGFIPPVALSPFLEIHPCLSTTQLGFHSFDLTLSRTRLLVQGRSCGQPLTLDNSVPGHYFLQLSRTKFAKAIGKRLQEPR